MGLTVRYDQRGARRVLLVLIAVELLMSVTYFVAHVLGAARRGGAISTFIDFDLEASFPTWFSSVQLLAIGAVLILAGTNDAQRLLSTRFLLAAGALFVFLAADEGAGIHERVNGGMADLNLTFLAFQDDHGAWIALYAFVGLLIIVLSTRHLITLWRHYRHETRVALIGFSLYGAGAVGLEIVSYFLRSAGRDTGYRLEVLFEELLEMAGATVVLYAVLLLALRVSTHRPPSSDSEVLEGVG
jgi:hypothetical protein